MTLVDEVLLDQLEIKELEDSVMGLLCCVTFGGKDEDEQFIRERIAHLRSPEYRGSLDSLSDLGAVSDPAGRFYFLICNLDSLLESSSERNEKTGTSPRQARAEEIYYELMGSEEYN